MSNFICSVASYFVNSAWEIPLVAAAGWVASRALRRLGPRVDHLVWVSTLLLAVFAPALPLWAWFSEIFHRSVGSGQSSIALVTGETARLSSGSAMPVPPWVIFTLLGFYAVAFFYFAARLAWSLSQTVGLLREASPLTLNTGKERLWMRCLEALSISDAALLSTERVTGPVTISFWRSVLLVPSGFAAECSDDDFLAASAHECSHIARHDFQKNLLYEIASLAIAFHPVTWMLKSRIAETREMICDEMATERVINSQEYTESLIRLAAMVSLSARAISFHAIGIFDANILEKRVMMIQAEKQQSSWWVRYGLIVLSVFVLLSAAIGAGRMAVAISPQDSGKVSKVIYKIGKDVSAPKLISSVQPQFPESARGQKDKFEGTCLIGFVVDEDGMPQDVHIVRSLRQDFDEKSIEAVQQYRFKPAMKAGVPVAVELKVEVKFARF
jgi:TonB family protein